MLHLAKVYCFLIDLLKFVITINLIFNLINGMIMMMMRNLFSLEEKNVKGVGVECNGWNLE